jgi:arylformamidase
MSNLVNRILLTVLSFAVLISGTALFSPACAKGKYTRQFSPNIPYKKNAGPHNLLNVYRPKRGKITKNRPVVFLVHGGYWSYGPGPGAGFNKDNYVPFAKNIARRGYIVVTPNYGVAPLFKYPVFIKDVAAAFKWTVRNIRKYGGDTKQIYVAGHSAGGHLAALLATNHKYLKQVRLSPRLIKGVISISGAFDLMDVSRKGKDKLPIGRKHFADASPARFVPKVAKKLPPFHLLVGDGKDERPFRRYYKSFKKLLKKHRVPVSGKILRKKAHLTIIVGSKAVNEVDRFIKSNKRRR